MAEDNIQSTVVQDDAEVASNLHAAGKGKGMGLPKEGIHAVTTDAAEHHAEPTVLGLDAPAFVALAMLAFLIVLLVKKVPAIIGRGLDKQIAAIRTRLDEARDLRSEAEALRDEYARRLAALEQDAQKMLAHADEEARAVLAKAEADARELTVRRAKMAEDKIAAAERAAIQAVRAKAAEAATAAAGTLLADRVGPDADKAIVDRTIAGISRLN